MKKPRKQKKFNAAAPGRESRRHASVTKTARASNCGKRSPWLAGKLRTGAELAALLWAVSSVNARFGAILVLLMLLYWLQREQPKSRALAGSMRVWLLNRNLPWLERGIAELRALTAKGAR